MEVEKEEPTKESKEELLRRQGEKKERKTPEVQQGVCVKGS